MSTHGPGRSYSLAEINDRPERAQRLLVARLAASLSLRQAARLVGCSATYVFRVETGEVAVSERQVRRFTDAYDRLVRP